MDPPVAAAATAGRPDTVGGTGSAGPVAASPTAVASSLSGADRRTAEKEMSALDRKIAKVGADRKKLLDAFAAHDQSDYAGLGALQTQLAGLEAEVEQLEERWLEVAELLGV